MDTFNKFERKPDDLKKLQGTLRNDRKLEDTIQPDILKEVPKPPTWMSNAGKREYKKLAPIIHAKSLLTQFDANLFFVACNEFGKYIEFEKYLKKEGYTYEIKGTTSTGGIFIKGEQQRPEVSLSKNSCDIARGIFQKFGLNPFDRAKLHIKEDKVENDPWDDYMKTKDLNGKSS